MRRRDIEVRLYDGIPFRRMGVTYDCAKISYTSRYSAAGTFSVSIPCKEEISRNFRTGTFIEIGRRFFGVIEEVSRASDLSGEMLTASGPDLLGLLKRKDTIPPDWPGGTATMGYDAVTGASESIIKHFVAGNAAAPYTAARRIPGLVIAPDQLRGLDDDRYMTRYDNLLDVISRIAGDAELGIRIKPDFDANQLIFDCYEGAERLPVVSTGRKTALEMRSLESLTNYRNVFYATMSGSEFADETLTMMYTRDDEPETPGGFERREMHMSISAKHPEPGEEYNELRRLALLRAVNHEPVNNLTCQINPARLTLGEDYELGDILTLQNRLWDVDRPARAVAVTVEHSGQRVSVNVQFGTEMPGLLTRAEWRKS